MRQLNIQQPTVARPTARAALGQEETNAASIGICLAGKLEQWHIQ